MSLAHNPRIVTNGLVFAYDMGPNPGINKSWKGKPTTNLHTNTDTLSGWSFNDSSYSNRKLIAGTSSAGHWVLQDKPLVSGTTYTQSVEVKYDGIQYFQIAPSTGFSTNFAAFDLISGTVAGGNTSSATITKLSDGYYKCTYTAPATSTVSGRMAFGPNTSSTTRLAAWVGNGVNGVFLRNPQIEANSFATPFVDGTRSNTQAILDWTGNNTITVNSLIYEDDGTFRFDGSSNVISFPENSLLNTQTPSVEVWAKTNATSQNGFWFEKGNVNTQYSLFQEGGSIRWRANFGSGLVNMISTTTASYINTTDWFHTVATFESGQQYVYINGNQVGSNTLTGTLATNPNGCSIGAYGGFNGSRGYYYNGDIGSVKVYNKVLSAAEIKQNFNALRGRYGI